MSCTTVKALWPGEKHSDFEELVNSHGSAPVIWDAMCRKYYGTDPFAFYGMVNILCTRWRDLSIPKHHRAVLMMTFDRAYIIRADYAKAAVDIRAWLKDFPQGIECINHWPRLAEIFESDPEIPAIGLYLTSVGDDPFEGQWDEEKEEYSQPDWEQCFDIYEEMEIFEEAVKQCG